MAYEFEVACGSVTGRDHILAGRNNQDAYVVTSNGEITVAVVCDGCSGKDQTEGKYSEVGALLSAKFLSVAFFDSARLWTEIWNSAYQQSASFFPYAEPVRKDVIARLHALAEHMGSSMTVVVKNYFLFTAVAAIITPYRTWIYSIGDGVYAVNGEFTQIGPFPDNMPPYLAYGGMVNSSISQDLTVFNLHKSMATADIKSLMIGTDGVIDFHAAAEKNIPGKQELLGPVSQFWTEDKYMTNPDQIRRRLVLANREYAVADWEQRMIRKEVGLLHDDTTIIVMRRKSPQRGT